jgi:hypothetical protein
VLCFAKQQRCRCTVDLAVLSGCRKCYVCCTALLAANKSPAVYADNAALTLLLLLQSCCCMCTGLVSKRTQQPVLSAHSPNCSCCRLITDSAHLQAVEQLVALPCCFGTVVYVL